MNIDMKRDTTIGQRFSILSRFLSASAILTSLLQSVLFSVEGWGTTSGTVAIGLAALTILLAIRFFATNDHRLLGLVLIFYCGQLAVFLVELLGVEPPFPHRLLHVAITSSYLATVMAAFLVIAKIAMPTNAILLSLSVWMGVYLCESTLELLTIWGNGDQSKHTVSAPTWIGDSEVSTPEWVGGMLFHPLLHLSYAPYSLIKTYYPDNPRGYFEEEDLEHSQWWLRVTQGNVANLLFPRDNPDGVRVAIRKAGTKDAWSIQLNQAQLKVMANHRYTVEFRARADRPRSIIVGFARSREPMTNLGLWKEIQLTTEWESFDEDFIALRDEDHARIHFDVGGSDIPVEFSNVHLRGDIDGKPVTPNTSKRYFVSYRFNALGCRGRDFPIPRTRGTVRILLLGDSYTLGVGVHERDTVANHLEHLLNKKVHTGESKEIYEVINCGVSGYGTKDERIFYQLFGSKYDPKIVLLSMVWNDDSSFWEELQRGDYRSPGKLEYLSYIWAKVQKYRYRPPSQDFSGSVEEIRQLDSEVRKQGARLGVIIFRNDCNYEGSNISGKTWNLLTKTVTEGFQDTDIPILDLGKVLCEKGNETYLAAHPIIDFHPNEIATKLAAERIVDYLRTEKLLKPQRDSQGNRQGIIGPRG